MKASGKFCPICKNKNAYTASSCSYCGAVLEENLTYAGATTKDTGGLSSIPLDNLGSFVDMALIPQGGIGIYVAGALKPYYLDMDKDLIVGRKLEAASEAILDLSDLDGFNLGLSRRHAMLRRTESSYELTDLSSTNGTWLNNERLAPNKPYPFASGSQLRLGRMRLFVLYRHALEGIKKTKS